MKSLAHGQQTGNAPSSDSHKAGAYLHSSGHGTHSHHAFLSMMSFMPQCSHLSSFLLWLSHSYRGVIRKTSLIFRAMVRRLGGTCIGAKIMFWWGRTLKKKKNLSWVFIITFKRRRQSQCVLIGWPFNLNNFNFWKICIILIDLISQWTKKTGLVLHRWTVKVKWRSGQKN